jgi:hypothetical protein
MQTLYNTGKYFFAVSIFAFGVIQLVTQNFMTGLLPFPDALPARHFWVGFISILFIILSGLVMINKKPQTASFFISLMLLLLLIYPISFLLIEHIYDPTAWTRFGEMLGICSGGFILAGTVNDYEITRPVTGSKIRQEAVVARYTFALSALVFGILHARYLDFIVTLIPSWLPLATLWAYMVCVAFFGAAISLFLKIKIKPISFLYGFMFLMWVLILHAPRVIKALNVEAEWSSLFVALAMSGICFMIAAKAYRRKM